MPDVTVGSILATIRADTSNFEAGIRRAEQGVAGLDTQVSQSVSRINARTANLGGQGFDRLRQQVADFQHALDPLNQALARSSGLANLQTTLRAAGVESDTTAQRIRVLGNALQESLLNRGLSPTATQVRQATTELRGLSEQAARTRLDRINAQTAARDIDALNQALARSSRLGDLQSSLRAAGIESDTTAQRIRVLTTALQEGLVNRGLSPLTPQIQQATTQLRALQSAAEGQRGTASLAQGLQGLEQALARVQRLDTLQSTFRRAGAEANVTAEKIRVLSNAIREGLVTRGLSPLTPQIQQATRQLAALQVAAKQSDLSAFNAALHQSAEGAGLLHSALGRASRTAGAFAAITAGFALAGFASDIVRVGLENESLARSFKAIEGSSAAATDTLTFLRNEADRIGVSFEVLATRFRGVEAAALAGGFSAAAARDVFIKLSEAAVVLGVDNQRLGLIFTAISQVFSKSQLSAEDFTQQLGESFPVALGLLSAAFGKTTAEIREFIKQGLSSRVLLTLAQQASRQFGPELANSVESSTQAFARLGNQIRDLKGAIADSGVLQLLTFLARGTTALLRDLTGQRGGLVDPRPPASAFENQLEVQRRVAERILNVQDQIALIPPQFQREPSTTSRFTEELPRRYSALSRTLQNLQKEYDEVTKRVIALNAETQKRETERLAIEAPTARDLGVDQISRVLKETDTDLAVIQRRLETLPDVSRKAFDPAAERARVLGKAITDVNTALIRNNLSLKDLPPDVARRIDQLGAQLTSDANAQAQTEGIERLRNVLGDFTRGIVEIDERTKGLGSGIDAATQRFELAERVLAKVREHLQESNLTLAALPDNERVVIEGLQRIVNEAAKASETLSAIDVLRLGAGRAGLVRPDRDRARDVEEVEEIRRRENLLRQVGREFEALQEGAKRLGMEFGQAFDNDDIDGIREAQQSLADLNAEIALVEVDRLQDLAFRMGDVGDASGALSESAGILQTALRDAILQGASEERIGKLRASLRALQRDLRNLEDSAEDVAEAFARAQRRQLPLRPGSQATRGDRQDLLEERERIRTSPNFNEDDRAAAIRRVNVELGKTTLVGEAVALVGEAIGDAFDQSLQGIIQGTKSVADAFRDLAQSILLSIGKVLVQKGITLLVEAALGGAGANTGGNVALAEGGTVSRAQLALIGEAGAEAVIPLTKFRQDQTLAEILPQLPRINGAQVGALPARRENIETLRVPKLADGLVIGNPMPSLRLGAAGLGAAGAAITPPRAPAAAPVVNVINVATNEEAEREAASRRSRGEEVIINTVLGELQRGTGSRLMQTLRSIQR